MVATTGTAGTTASATAPMPRASAAAPTRNTRPSSHLPSLRPRSQEPNAQAMDATVRARPACAGLALTVASIAWAFGSWLRGRSEARWDDGRVFRVGAAALALGIGAVALAVVPAVPVVATILGWGLAGFGMGLVYPTTSRRRGVDQTHPEAGQAPAQDGRDHRHGGHDGERDGPDAEGQCGGPHPEHASVVP